MPEIAQAATVRCPRCQYPRTVSVELQDSGRVAVVRGLGDLVQVVTDRVRLVLSDPEFDRAMAFLPTTCPNPECTLRAYQYNPLTKETRE